MNWLPVVTSLLLLLALVAVVFRMRRAVRGIWARLEALQVSQRHFANRTVSDLLVLHSELASLVHDKQLCFASQGGEDVWLWNRFGRREHGVFVEIGAFNGIDASNTWFFEQLGWTGVLVEPDPQIAAECKGNRPNSVTVQAAAGRETGQVTLQRFKSSANWSGMLSHVGALDAHADRLKRMEGSVESVSVPMRRMDDVLAEAEIGVIDFISIDVEGAEMSVLDGLDLQRWKPSIIVLENTYEGADGQNLIGRMASSGYTKCGSIGANDFFAANAGLAA